MGLFFFVFIAKRFEVETGFLERILIVMRKFPNSKVACYVGVTWAWSPTSTWQQHKYNISYSLWRSVGRVMNHGATHLVSNGTCTKQRLGNIVYSIRSRVSFSSMQGLYIPEHTARPWREILSNILCVQCVMSSIRQDYILPCMGITVTFFIFFLSLKKPYMPDSLINNIML